MLEDRRIAVRAKGIRAGDNTITNTNINTNTNTNGTLPTSLDDLFEDQDQGRGASGVGGVGASGKIGNDKNKNNSNSSNSKRKRSGSMEEDEGERGHSGNNSRSTTVLLEDDDDPFAVRMSSSGVLIVEAKSSEKDKDLSTNGIKGNNSGGPKADGAADAGENVNFNRGVNQTTKAGSNKKARKAEPGQEYVHTYLSCLIDWVIYLFMSYDSIISLSLYLYLSLCLYAYVSISLSLYLSISLYLYISISLSLYLYLSISLSLCLSISLSLYLSIYLYLSLYAYVSMPLCLCLSMPMSVMVAISRAGSYRVYRVVCALESQCRSGISLILIY